MIKGNARVHGSLTAPHTWCQECPKAIRCENNKVVSMQQSNHRNNIRGMRLKSVHTRVLLLWERVPLL
jgi:hypothetical protein